VRWAPGHTNRQAPPTALHGVNSDMMMKRARGDPITCYAALMRFFPQFKVLGCLQWLASSRPPGPWASTKGIPSHTLKGACASTTSTPPPCTQTLLTHCLYYSGAYFVPMLTPPGAPGHQLPGAPSHTVKFRVKGLGSGVITYLVSGLTCASRGDRRVRTSSSFVTPSMGT